jgi:hypothetical protein
MTDQYLEMTSFDDSIEVNDLEAREKGRTRKERRRKSEAVYWGGVFLWAGLVFAADALGITPQIGDSNAWSLVFFGAGLYGLFLLGISVVIPGYDRPTAWDYVWSGGVLVVGLGGMTSVDVFWPIVLIVAGLAILGEGFLRRE